MSPPAARRVVRALEKEGIGLALGIPGTHNIELYDALSGSDSVETVLVTDEQSASFMADGAWRASGRMACVNVVPGAGLTHALSGIAEAYMDNVPMLVLGCGIRRDSEMAFQLHDVDQASIVEPVVKGTFRPGRAEEIEPTIRRACRLARGGAPGPVFVEIPANLYMVTGSGEAGSGAAPPDGEEVAPAAPDGEAVEGAARILREARRPLLYVGLGAAGAREEVLELAERLEAPVSSTFQGKGVFPESHPLALWPGFGNSAPPFARAVAGSCDATLALGCRFGEVGTGSYGLEPPGPLIHVDIDPRVPGRNFRAEVASVVDAGAFGGALLEALGDGGREPDRELRRRIREGHEGVRREWEGEVGGPGVTPYHLLSTLQEALGPDAVYTTDSGNGTFLAVECLRLDRPGLFLAPVDYSCMGYSVPAAIGAGLARPDGPVVALAGDGAFLMTGLELLTAAREGIPVQTYVLRDRELAQIAQFQETAYNRKASSQVADYDLEGLARGLGVPFLRVTDDEDVAGGVEEARERAAGGSPVLVEVAIDYSRKTYFTRGVVKTNFLRLPLRDRLRFLGRAVVRRVTE